MSAWLEDRVAGTRWTLAVAFGDAAAIALFVALGEIRHGGTFSGGLATFLQFGGGWVLAAVPAGAYAAGALGSPRRAVVQGVATWVVAALIAQLIRLLVTPGNQVQPAFVLVSIGVGGLLVGSWRYLAARAVS